MIKQAHTYLVGALSGVTLIGIAIAVFVVLVSAQVFHELPIVNASSPDDNAAAVSPAQALPADGGATAAKTGGLANPARPDAAADKSALAAKPTGGHHAHRVGETAQRLLHPPGGLEAEHHRGGAGLDGARIVAVHRGDGAATGGDGARGHAGAGDAVAAAGEGGHVFGEHRTAEEIGYHRRGNAATGQRQASRHN